MTISRIKTLLSSFLPRERLVAILCLISLSGSVECAPLPAQSIDLNSTISGISLLPYARTIKEDSSNNTPEQLLHLPSNPEQFKQKHIASFGFSHSAHWFIVSINNTETSPIKRLLVFEPTWLDKISVHLVKSDGNTQTFEGGDKTLFNNRSISHRNINVELTLPPGNNQLLVRTETSDPYLVEISLWERTAFYKKNSDEMLYLGLIYGVVIAMLLYNLVLFISVKESVYAAYVTYLFFFITMHSTYNGHLYPLLWPESPEWSNWAHSIFIYCFIASGLFFAIKFLELRDRQKTAYLWAKRLGIAIIASFCLTAILGGYRLHVSTSIIWVIIYAPFVLVLGLVSLKAGNRAARYFLTAAIAGFIGSFITALTVSGLIPFTFYTYHAIDIGMVIDAILLSIALADKLRLARAEAESAKIRLLQATRAHAQQLEVTIAERTRELREANTTKDKFFSIIAHDLRGPISSLETIFNNIVKNVDDFDEELLQAARLTTKNTNELLEQLLTWARSQKGEIHCNPEPLEMQRIFEEVQELFSTQARSKNIKLNLALSAPLWAIADTGMIHTVLRNLTNNALKFTNAGGTVCSNVIDRNDHYLFQITDDGTGMTEETQKNLFQLDIKTHSSPGTQAESGTGLGLILCKEFIEKNGGTIGADSKQGKGATFWFTLPKQQQNVSD